MLCLSHLSLIFPGDIWLLSRGLLLEVDRDAFEGRRLLTTWTSRPIGTDESKTQTRVPSLLLPSTCSGGGDKNSGTMTQCQLHLPSVAPEGSLFFRGVREVLRCIQPGFHSSHGETCWYRASCMPPEIGERRFSSPTGP